MTWTDKPVFSANLAKRWRAIVRKAGIVRCATFASLQAAKSWAG